MKKSLIKTAAVFSAAVISVYGCFGSFAGCAAETEQKEVTIAFDFGADLSEIEPWYGTDGELTDMTKFESYTVEKGSVTGIPVGAFKREGYVFSGWTPDDFYGYYCGETYNVPADYEGDTITFKAVWHDPRDDRSTYYTYNVVMDGEPIERPAWLKDAVLTPGMIYEPNYASIKIDGASSYGLTDGERNYYIGTKLVVTEEDREFTPIWKREIKITYFAGDVDRLNGNTSVTFTKMEDGRDELATSDRFSRNGFNLVGWVSDMDGKTYKTGETITMPGHDITFTAVWEPKTYVVVFKTGNGGANKKVSGVTDTAIVCPDPEHTVNGMSFVGWKDDEGVIYPAGSEYTIKGALPGSGISLQGVWIEGELPPETSEPSTDEPVKVSLLGDANCDGKLTIADSTAILQSLGNPDKYGLSAQGMINADCCDPGNGVLPSDALSIQKIDAKIIPVLPEITK